MGVVPLLRADTSHVSEGRPPATLKLRRVAAEPKSCASYLYGLWLAKTSFELSNLVSWKKETRQVKSNYYYCWQSKYSNLTGKMLASAATPGTKRVINCTQLKALYGHLVLGAVCEITLGIFIGD